MREWERSRKCPLLPQDQMNPIFGHRLDFVKRMDVDLRKDSIIVVNIVHGVDNKYAVLAKINSILVNQNNEDIHLSCSMFVTTNFNQNLDCYEIEPTNPPENRLFNINTLEIMETFKAYEIDGKDYIILRKIN